MNRFVALSVCGLCVCTLVGVAQGQTNVGELGRRGWFGVALAPHEGGAAVTAVVDGSTASAEGIRVGDVIEAVDRGAVRAPGDVVAAMGRHSGGDTVLIDLVRDGKRESRSVVLRPWPHETLPGVSFEYSSVTLADDSRLRTILSVPQPVVGPLPAVMLLQGGGCGSVDVPVAADVGPSGLVRTIAGSGFVTLRVEKSGVGDSQGPPCDTIGYAQELAGYRAALTMLKRHPSVDPDRVVLLGISLGGVFAPILGRENPARGIVVYGTLATPPSPYPGRSELFFDEFAAVDVPAAWAAVDSRVLSLHGQFDEGTSQADHAKIAAIVNSRRAGAASHRELEGLDHCWTRHESLDQSRNRCGTGQATSQLNDAVLEFLRALP